MQGERDFAVEKLLSFIEETFPVPGRFRSKLPSDVAELSRLLTSARGERDSGYLNRPNLLSAYLRYFLPWNVFRLGRLFSFKAGSRETDSSLLPDLTDGDAITDLGSGPLTLPIALWIAFPRLRSVKLEFRCVDKSAAVLEAGQKLFKTMCAAASVRGGASSAGSGDSPLGEHAGCAWKIKVIHDSIDAPIRGKSAKLVTAINVFNENFSGTQRGALERSVEKAAAILCKLCVDEGSMLVAEPGNPQGGAFISALRGALIAKGKSPAAPCTHREACPLPGTGAGRGTKAKWCHFAFDTDTAPEALRKLSAAAGIPKERATLSFLLADSAKPGKTETAAEQGKPEKAPPVGHGAVLSNSSLLPNSSGAEEDSSCIRIISDTFPVPVEKGGLGCYGCSERGMVLVAGKSTAASKDGLPCLAEPGALLKLPFPAKERRDPKTGALIVPLKGN